MKVARQVLRKVKTYGLVDTNLNHILFSRRFVKQRVRTGRKFKRLIKKMNKLSTKYARCGKMTTEVPHD